MDDLGDFFGLGRPQVSVPESPPALKEEPSLSIQEHQILEEMEAQFRSEDPRRADFIDAMRSAGQLLNRQFIKTVSQQPRSHIATLQKPPTQKEQCAISLSEDTSSRIDSFITGERVAPTLDKEDVVSPWPSLQSLYRLENEDFRKYCDPKLGVSDATLPFLRALAHNSGINPKPNVAGPLQQSSAMHVRIAAYSEILATALHTFLAKLLNTLSLARNRPLDQLPQLVDNLYRSTETVQPLASALADASRDHIKLASRGVARAIRQRRKAVIPKATGETAQQILLSPPSASCLMGKEFVDTHSQRASVQSSVNTAAKNYLQVVHSKEKSSLKRRHTPVPQQDTNKKPKQAVTFQEPFSAPAPKGRGVTHNQNRNRSQQGNVHQPTTTASQQSGRRGRYRWPNKRGRGRGGRGSHRGAQ